MTYKEIGDKLGLRPVPTSEDGMRQRTLDIFCDSISGDGLTVKKFGLGSEFRPSPTSAKDFAILVGCTEVGN